MCKFYQGPEDRLLRDRLAAVFEKVIQDKPLASRPVCFSLFLLLTTTTTSTCVCILKGAQESRENYFVALKKKAIVDKAEVERMPWTEEAEEAVEML